MQLIRRILTPTDFGPSSAHAVSFAAGLAKELDAQLTLMHVVDELWPKLPTEAAPPVVGPSVEEREQEANLRLADTVLSIGDIAPWPDVVVRHGRAWEEIVRCAEALDCDLVVMGTHGRKGPSRWLLGSVAEKVVRNCKRPTLTVRADATERTSTEREGSETNRGLPESATSVKGVMVDALHLPRGPDGQKTLASGVRVGMRLWDHEARGDSPESQRDYEVVGYVLAGYAELQIEGETIRLEPGDSYWVPRHARHRYHILAPLTVVEAISPPSPSEVERPRQQRGESPSWARR
jgi:nucleotide-binding universal stress UspA family protein/quercetin dioxygenase-like cupin family protein